MDSQEAERTLQEFLKRYRAHTHAELATLVGEQKTFEIRGESGAHYQIEVQVFWDSRSSGMIRVLGSIDDGGVRAFSHCPMTSSWHAMVRLLTNESVVFQRS